MSSKGSTFNVDGKIQMVRAMWAKSIWQSARQRLLRKVVSLSTKVRFQGKQIPSGSYIFKVWKHLQFLKTYLPICFVQHI